MKGNMKAAVFKDVERIDIEVMPIPSCPPDGILMRICACGICGSDVRNYHNGLKGGKGHFIPPRRACGVGPGCELRTLLVLQKRAGESL